tara:strand:- start:289 stop:522 length:234 start_codon:yes stop_codon:yes gene_type:complete
MAFKKTHDANNLEVIKTGQKPYPVGKKFVYDGKTWKVREAYTDSGEEWRRIISSAGEEEIMSLKTLLKEEEEMEDIN